MNLQVFALPTLVILAISSIWIILISNWKVRLSLLAIIYFGEFLLISLSWPIEMAVSKLIAGWMAAAVLGMALASNPPPPTSRVGLSKASHTSPVFIFRIVNLNLATIFYLIAAVLVSLFTLSIAAIVKRWIPGITDVQIWAGLLLFGMGILQAGLRADIFSNTLGMLILLCGFEIIFAGAERSTLIGGLLAAITLGLALVGAYLITSPHMEENE